MVLLGDLDEILLEEGSRSRESNHLGDDPNARVDLLLEPIIALVVNYEKPMVSCVNISQLLINGDGLFDVLISYFIARLIKISSPIRCRNHMDDRIISLVSERDIVPTLLLEY
jgi:hypothetical protein